MSDDIWDNDMVQLARLLSEIHGVGLDEAHMEDLCNSMDLDADRIKELLCRAEHALEKYKPRMLETGTKLRRAVFEIEVLYDAEGVKDPDSWSVGVIHELVTRGPASGSTTLVSDVELTREEMAEALTAQGSDPEFLLGELEDGDV